MSDQTLTLGDRKRGRFLLWLILAALAAIALAAAAIVTSRTAVAPAAMSEPMFPGLGEAAARATQIRIEGPSLKLTLNKAADGKWTIGERDNYPANNEGVRALVLSLSELTLVERRTADPARHASLQLTTGEGGTGYGITLQAADGSIIAGIVAGKVSTRAAGSTQGTLFVRKAGEDQTWLARGIVAVPASVGAALDKALFPFDRDRMMRARFEPNGAKPYTIARDTIGADYTLDAVPDGKTVDPLVLLAPATAIGGFSFTDVAKAERVDMKEAGTATFETFDGLVIKAAIKKNGDADAQITLEASVDDKQAAVAPPPARDKVKIDPAAEAAAINARVSGWAYTVPGFVASNMMPAPDTLVKDKTPATPPDGTAPEQPLEPAPDPGPTPATPPPN